VSKSGNTGEDIQLDVAPSTDPTQESIPRSRPRASAASSRVRTSGEPIIQLPSTEPSGEASKLGSTTPLTTKTTVEVSSPASASTANDLPPTKEAISLVIVKPAKKQESSETNASQKKTDSAPAINKKEEKQDSDTNKTNSDPPSPDIADTPYSAGSYAPLVRKLREEARIARTKDDYSKLPCKHKCRNKLSCPHLCCHLSIDDQYVPDTKIRKTNEELSKITETDEKILEGKSTDKESKDNESDETKEQKKGKEKVRGKQREREHKNDNEKEEKQKAIEREKESEKENVRETTRKRT